jgi:YfiH family protein
LKIDNDKVIINKRGELTFLEFANLKKYDRILTHCFTTRLGGVSEGECSTLNLSFNRNDSRENVIQNYQSISRALGVDFDKIVLSDQVHDNKIYIVHKEDAGKGLTRESDIKCYDGLATNEKGIPLVTFYADCVPVLMLDTKNEAIAAVHSGWKSTTKKISIEAVKRLQQEYNTDLKDLQIAIGPSLCQNCFEVDKEVYDLFRDNYDWIDKYTEVKSGKYYIALQKVIKHSLADAGVPKENILISDICTKCNNDVFFSYRGDNKKTGSLAAFMMLRE